MADFTPPPVFNPEQTPAPLPSTVSMNPPMVGEASPFLRVDGQNRDLILESIRTWVRNELLKWAAAWQDYQDDYAADLAAWINAYVTSFQAYLEEVTDELRAEVAAAIEEIRQEVINNSITLQDPVLAGILGNTNSASRVFLDALLDTATTLYPQSSFRLDTLPRAVKEFVSINERTYQRSAVAPGPEQGDYYTVYFDRYHNPIISRYKSDERTFEEFNLSDVTSSPLKRTVNDGHNSLSVFRDNLGYLYVAGNLHGDQLVILKSRNPHDIREWAPMNLSTLTCDTASYPAFVALNDGTCLIQWRNGGAGENGTWYFVRMLDNGVLGAQVPVFTGATDSAYPNQVQVDSTGRIHVFYMWRSGGNSHFGYVRTDNNFGSVQTMSGANVALPITSANAAPYIITGPHSYINQCGAAIDPVTNFPHAVLRTSTGNYRVDHIYWDGDEWITEQVYTGVGNGVGRPGAFATADGRIYAAFRDGNRIAATRIWPTIGSKEILVPYSVGGPEAGWELAFDEQYLKSDDRLRFFVQPVSSDAANTANNTMKEGTWGGVWSMSVAESAIKNAGKKSGISSPATPMSPGPAFIAQDRHVEPGNVLRNNIGNRWITPSGPRAATASLVQDRVYATVHNFEASGMVDKLGIRVTGAGVAATVKGYIFTERGQVGPGRPIVAETAEINIVAGAVELPLTVPLWVRAGDGLAVNQYFIGLRFRYTTVPVLVSNSIPDRSIQASTLAEVVNEPRSAWVSTAAVADGATEIGSLGGAYLAPLIAVHTANWS